MNGFKETKKLYVSFLNICQTRDLLLLFFVAFAIDIVQLIQLRALIVATSIDIADMCPHQ